jgi:hypothetical protein
MTFRRRRIAPGIVRMLCALALVAASFAHRPAFAASEGVSATVVFPDGSVGSNCLGGDEGKAKGSPASAGCPFCRIGGAIVPPAPAQTFVSCALLPDGDVPAPAEARPPRQAFLPNAPLRGPPTARG